MFLFPLYVLTVWFLVGKWRRTWLGALVLLLGIAGAFLVWLVYRTAVQWFGGHIPMESTRTLVGATGALAGGIGTYIFVLPRKTPRGHCRRCGYDLRGHEEDDAKCPECGVVASRGA